MNLEDEIREHIVDVMVKMKCGRYGCEGIMEKKTKDWGGVKVKNPFWLCPLCGNTREIDNESTKR